MANSQPTTITKRNILAVEGKDEENFFAKLLSHMGIADQVQVEPVGGKSEFRNKLPTLLKVPGFYLADGSSFVKRLAIVRDKDEDDAFTSIANIVSNAGLCPPPDHATFSSGDPEVGVFIMPGGDVEGTMLEDLCLATAKSHPAMGCVNEFTECIGELADPPRNLSKATCQAFLAAQSEIVSHVGLGAQRGYWDFDSPALDEIKRFLLHLK